MKRTVMWPLLVKSENHFRSIDQRRMMSNMALTKKTRNETALMLAQFTKPPHYMPGDPPPANRITVTLIRISAGELDSDAALGGSMKAVRDGVADWLGLDDRDHRVEWLYGQQCCQRKQHGVRIEIEDLSPGGDVVRILPGAPNRLSLVRSEGKPRPLGGALPPPPPQEQGLVFTRPCLAAPPWLEDGVVVEVPIDGEPPMSIRMRVPTTALASSLCRLRPGTLVELFRGEVEDADLGWCWLYQSA